MGGGAASAAVLLLGSYRVETALLLALRVLTLQRNVFLEGSAVPQISGTQIQFSLCICSTVGDMFPQDPAT